MNLPNKLTVARILMIPFFLISLYTLDKPMANYVGLVIFVIACLTDFLDGYIARKNKLITDFGKLMDPFADKLLVTAAFLYLLEIGRISTWFVLIIVAREYFISIFRALAASKGVVLAAGIWGKVKTVITMITIPIILIEFYSPLLTSLANIFLLLTLFFTVYSGADYVIKNKEVFKK